jgi:hypothetical protein
MLIGHENVPDAAGVPAGAAFLGGHATMTHACLKAGAALLVLGGFALASPALAISPLPLNGNGPVLIPIQDEENQELWHDLRPDVTPPEAAVGDDDPLAPKEETQEEPKAKEKGSGDIEEKELKEDGLIPQ